MRHRVEVPESVQRKARALGADGRRWLDQLPDLLADVESDWGIRIGRARSGGSAGYVAEATTADGTPVVFKMAMPDGLEGNGDFGRELDAVRLGQGRGYVRLLRVDAERRMMLQERLGRPLGDLGIEIERQLEIIAGTVSRGWQPAPSTSRWRTGAEQADFLAGFVASAWRGLGGPCPENTIRRAQRCAMARRDAFDRSSAVVIHGDAHSWNVLEDPNEPARSGGFKLIDPDGMVSEPAHDVAIAIRHWNEELLRADPNARVAAWCALLDERTGAGARAIWEWAFTERVSTGLFLLQLGDPTGQGFLRVAAALVEPTRF